MAIRKYEEKVKYGKGKTVRKGLIKKIDERKERQHVIR